jgi:hypothetical protein
MVGGHSHALALLEGFEMLIDSGRGPDEQVRWSVAAEWREKIVYSQGSSTGHVRRQPDAGLSDLVSRCSIAKLALVWWGNQMNVRALLCDARPFDVVLVSDGPTPLAQSAELIPCSVVEACVRQSLGHEGTLARIIAGARERGAKVSLLGPPPPLPEEAVRERLAMSPHFIKLMEHTKWSPRDAPVVSDQVRRRLHTILLRVYESFAREHGADFLPPPSDVVDADGMLDSLYWSSDVTHANAEYGAKYLQGVIRWAEESRYE